MMAIIIRATTLFVLVSRSATLQFGQQLNISEADPHKPIYRHRLFNFQDMQYSADIQLGGQTIRGILDTGSFEMLVFSKECKTCGSAKAYSPRVSMFFKMGIRRRVHSYGSGSCSARDARDKIEIGPLTAPSQAFWEAVDCEMPLLDTAEFNAVVGIGPPGQPLATAKSGLEQVKEVESMSRRNRGGNVPLQVKKLKREYQEDVEDAPKKPSLLESLGTTLFSTCLERGPGAPGWLIWNDLDPRKRPLFTGIKVVGEVTWGVKLSGVSFEGGASSTSVHLGCSNGCGAVLDTGTSLIAVPTSVYHKAFKTIQRMHTDCSDISHFPDLILNVGGKNLRLPPEAYIGELVGDVNPNVKNYLNLRSLGRGRRKVGDSKHTCEFLLMDMGDQSTQFGPMAIIGMPFFREYYTTFNVGTSAEDRSIFFAPANDRCEPASENDLGLDKLGSTHYSFRGKSKARRPRKVDASTIRLPNRHGGPHLF